MKIPIIYEDENIVAVNKPAGVLVHKTAHKEDEETINDWFLKKYPGVKDVGDSPDRPGIVHRLDKDTSGVLILTKNQPAFDYVKGLFQSKEIKKTYIALVYGMPRSEKGVIEKPIGLKAGTIKRTIFGGKMIKEAVTEYKVVKRFKNYTLLEITPRTGRTHQIRVHCASMSNPIVGDKLYGGKKARENELGVNRQFLHAATLEMALAPGKRVVLSAKLPPELEDILKTLEK